MSAEEEIRRRIRARSSITFAEFMDLALYWPQGGYYLEAEPTGPSGDYYTSSLVHPVFGALLAVQLFQMWQLLGHPNPFTVVELGAGNGLLCRDITAGSAHLPEDFADSLRYLCLDRRAGPGLERDSSGKSGRSAVHRLVTSVIPLRGIVGCILSNELLDAFPVHQITRREGRVQEVRVALQGDRLTEVLGEPSTPGLASRLDNLGIELVEGQTAEINLCLDGWAAAVAAALDSGFVLTIDYGHPAAELYSPEKRLRGTLTTYYRHLQTDSPFQRIGRQDLTAQVDFTSVVGAGRRAGLEPAGFATQREFLGNLGLGRFQERLASLALPHRRLRSNRAAMADLARPGGLGDFKALVQAKNVEHLNLWGFEANLAALALAEQLPVPLLTPHHLSLPEGRYPQTEFQLDIEELWPFAADSPMAEEAGGEDI